MQLSIKDSDLKGVFNLEVNDIVFHCVRTILEQLAFPGRFHDLCHVCIALCTTWALLSCRNNSVSRVQSKCSISQGSLYVLQSSQSLLNCLLKPFLKRHCSFSSAVVKSLYLAFPRCWDFQSCIPRRSRLFTMLNWVEAQSAGARFIGNQTWLSHPVDKSAIFWI